LARRDTPAAVVEGVATGEGGENPVDPRVDWVSVGLFVVIAFGLGWWCFAGLLALGAGLPLRAALGSFAPAVAALLTIWLRGQPLRGLGLGIRRDRAYLYAYLIPPLLTFAGIAGHVA
jgi:hypothetical protein